jgi:hypothetical protein
MNHQCVNEDYSKEIGFAQKMGTLTMVSCGWLNGMIGREPGWLSLADLFVTELVYWREKIISSLQES